MPAGIVSSGRSHVTRCQPTCSSNALTAAASATQVQDLQRRVQMVNVDKSLAEYILEIIGRTRVNSELALGVSTRGALTWYRAAQAMALISERNFVIPDDIKETALPVLAHRVVCRGALREGHRQHASRILRMIIDSVAVPS